MTIHLSPSNRPTCSKRALMSGLLRGCAGVVLAATGLGRVTPAWATNVVGLWSELADWPLIPIHALVLPGGDVLTYGTNGDGQQTGRFIYDVWDWRAGLDGGHLTLPNSTQTDLFCNAQIILPQGGDVFLAGGDTWDGDSTTGRGNNDTIVFDPDDRTLTPGPDMSRPRWYATLTSMPNGEVYIQGGRGGADRAEVRAVDGSIRLLTGMDTSELNYWYPRNWVAPDGRVFGYAFRKMYYVDPSGIGTLTRVGATPSAGPEGVTSSEVMYAPGKILRVGGGEYAATGDRPARDAAIVIDINGARPSITTTAPMPRALHWHNATVVPDGRVVVTGGSALADQLVGVNDRAFIWDPATGTWTEGARTDSGKARLYHSIALLLPDASILVGGGGAGGNGPQTNTNAELYHPPYLFDGDGRLAPRPRITGGATSLRYNVLHNIKVDNGAAIARVTLIKTGSVTHSFDMEQRFLELTFRVEGNVLKVRAPANARLAPPGRYMLFVLNAQGVPSVARLVSI